MPSLKLFAAVAATLFVSANAQYYVDPTTVPKTTRDAWCSSQESACPLLCTQLPGGSLTTAVNECDSDLLTYQCTCGNGLVPNAANYSMTLPYFICTQWVQNCVAGCNGVTLCQSSCTQDHPCGATNPTRYNISTTTTSSTATATGASASNSAGVVYNGPGTTTPGSGSGSSSSSSTSSTNAQNGAQGMVAIGKSYGLAGLAGGIFAGFALFM